MRHRIKHIKTVSPKFWWNNRDIFLTRRGHRVAGILRYHNNGDNSTIYYKKG